MNYKAPRGTHDLWGMQAEKIQHLESLGRQQFRRYNYSELRFPTFEDAGLFTRSLGDTSDIVEKEMYVFTDRKERKLALRPEGTASVVRAYLEHQLAQQLPLGKFFYMGSMFRYERPQAGRYREFFQIGAEYFGNPSPVADAEIILLSRDILAAMGLKEIKVHLNTLGCPECRAAFRKALTDYFSPENVQRMGELCGDCKRRIERNPLRVLDCKIDGSRFTGLPKMETYLCEECRVHFCRVQELLGKGNCDFHIDHRMVRGLDYYTRTIFEIRSSSVGSQDALAAGGRYDNLVKELGGSPTPAVGFALGSERVVLAADNSGVSTYRDQKRVIFVAAVSPALEKDAFAIAAMLRAQGSAATIEGPYAEKSLKSQMKLADKLNAETTIILGEEELKRNMVLVRNMKTQEQSEVSIENIIEKCI